jgi:hypothetical protein
MRGRTGGLATAALASLALIATGCGGGGAEPEPGGSQPASQTGGEIVVAGCTPENPLIPGATSETCGGDIIDAMTSKLVEYNTENAAPENDIAESIETTDNKLFTVKLKLQVPRRHRRQGQELRRRLELHRLRPQRPRRQLLLRAGGGVQRRPVPRRRVQAEAKG